MRDDTTIPAELLAIAERLGFATLDTRNDRSDFSEIAVWTLRDALLSAYAAGQRSSPPPAPPTRCVCPACGRDIEIRPIPPTTT
jgi:hypothetical protein